MAGGVRQASTEGARDSGHAAEKWTDVVGRCDEDRLSEAPPERKQKHSPCLLTEGHGGPWESPPPPQGQKLTGKAVHGLGLVLSVMA